MDSDKMVRFLTVAGWVANTALVVVTIAVIVLVVMELRLLTR